MEIVSIGAVDIYALISGYVGYGRKRNFRSIINLWTEAVFYCIGIELLFMLLNIKVISIKDLLVTLFPITKETYWYLSAYVVVFLFIPVLNWCVDKMNKNMATKIILLGLMLNWWDLISKKNIFKLYEGYSPIWLVFLYFVGAYIKKYYSDNEHKLLFRKYCGYIYILDICLVFAVIVLLQKITLCFFGKVKGDRFFIGYTTPTTILAAITILLFFSAIDINGKKTTKIISFLAPTTFSVYLIHNHPLIANYVMPQIFGRFVNSSFIMALLVAIIGPVLIFAIAALVDKGRIILFKIFKIDTICNKCGYWIKCWIGKIDSLL